jgi:hypothetical protein
LYRAGYSLLLLFCLLSLVSLTVGCTEAVRAKRSSIRKEEKHVDNRTGSLLYKPGFRIALVNATA